MDETNDSLPVALTYRRFPQALATRSSSPRRLHSVGGRVGLIFDWVRSLLINPKKRKLSDSGIRDDHLSKRLNMNSNPSAQGGPDEVRPGVNIPMATLTHNFIVRHTRN